EIAIDTAATTGTNDPLYLSRRSMTADLPNRRSPRRAPLQRRLFAHHRHNNFSPMPGAPMFEKENSLPGSKLHPPLRNRNGFAAMRQHHADMRWHVVGAFGIMLEIVGVLGHQPIEKFFEVAPCRWISILHHNQAATGVLRENCYHAVFNFALA